jgi:oligopeptide/dipeptide ABC transporter ATP-binding protein
LPEEILRIEDLVTYFFTEAGVVRAVDGISLSVNEREPTGFVGESGSGKTVTALSVLRLIPKPGKIVSGGIFHRGEDVLAKPEKEMRAFRGRTVAMVFQDPNSSLDPLFTIGSQLTEVLQAHERLTKGNAHDRALSLLEKVRIPEPEARLRAYPYELSGGMRQRIAIARAIATSPDILIADEPTTNLDVTIQAQVLELLKALQSELRMTLVMITHDMGIIAETTSRVVVMYAGRVAEAGTTKEIFHEMKHPYTAALLHAVPRIDMRRELVPIGGNIPNLISPPSGCRYHPRCPYAQQVCREKVPPLENIGDGRTISCHRWKEIDVKELA